MSPRATCVLPPRLRATLERHARTAAPNEACGLLVGEHTDEATRTIVDVTRARNLAPRPESAFVLDPMHVAAIDREARDRGVEIVGVWHSHPGGDAVQSEMDRRSAVGGWWSLIVGMGGGVSVRVWSGGGEVMVVAE